MKQIAAILSATLIASTIAAATTPPNLGWLKFESKVSDKVLMWKVRNETPPAVSPAQYPNRIEMHWKYTPDAAGMPSPDAEANFARLEAAMDPVQGDHVAYLMMIVTGNGDRTWFWYAGDPKAFAAALNDLLPGHPYPITLHLGGNEPDWKTYQTLRGNKH
jgi:hypothetical protein